MKNIDDLIKNYGNSLKKGGTIKNLIIMCWEIPLNGTKEEIEAFEKSVKQYVEENKERYMECERLGILPVTSDLIIECYK